MKIKITVRDLIVKDSWDNYSDEHGIHPSALSEGLVNYDDEIMLTEDEAKKYGILNNEL